MWTVDELVENCDLWKTTLELSLLQIIFLKLHWHMFTVKLLHFFQNVFIGMDHPIHGKNRRVIGNHIDNLASGVSDNFSFDEDEEEVCKNLFLRHLFLSTDYLKMQVLFLIYTIDCNRLGTLKYQVL